MFLCCVLCVVITNSDLQKEGEDRGESFLCFPVCWSDAFSSPFLVVLLLLVATGETATLVVSPLPIRHKTCSTSTLPQLGRWCLVLQVLAELIRHHWTISQHDPQLVG
jgi:hypothetical protein